MKVTPRNGLILISVIEDRESKTAAGIIIPSEIKQMFELARVEKVGRGVFDFGKHVATDDLTPGMLVLVKTDSRVAVDAVGRSALDLKDGDRKVSLVNQSDILAIIEEMPPAPLSLVQ